MLGHYEANLTDEGALVSQVTLPSNSFFNGELMQSWLSEIVDAKGLLRESPERVPGLRPVIDYTASEFVGHCLLADECRVAVDAPGSETGRARVTTLRLQCPIGEMEPDDESQRASRERRCRYFHEKEAPGNFMRAVTMAMVKFDRAEQQKSAADAAFATAQRGLSRG